MTPELYRRAGELFHRLRVLPKADRDTALNLACNGDAALRSEVLALLEADEEADEAFLQSPASQSTANPAAVPDSLPGTPRLPSLIAQRYKIVSRIGAGGMGVVYRAEDLRLSRPVALKVLTEAASSNEERYLRFQREARAASQLNHPHITAIYDAGVDNGLAYIAMELVEGKTLRQIIAEDCKHDAAAILHIVGQVAAALTAAHKAGIIHRDIKPENIIVRNDGVVKVLDFGLARIRLPQSDPNHPATLLTRPGQLAGTIQYLSPEQVLGQTCGPQSDIFSLGVVAYELATGVRPFDGPTDGAVFEAILHRQPKRPSELRPGLGTGLDALVLKALEKDSQARVATAEQLGIECERLASPGRSAAAPVGRRWLAIAAAAVVAVALGAGWFFRPAPEPRVLRTFQITNNGPVHEFVTDGSRIFYAAGTLSPEAPLYQVSADGGEPVIVPAIKGMLPLDSSPSGSELLLKEMGSGSISSQRLWVASLNGNPPRRLGDLEGRYARWSSTGDQIVYSTNHEIRLCKSDGSGSRQLFADPSGTPDNPYFLNGGRRIRFSLVSNNNSRLFEVDVNGEQVHPTLYDWDGGMESYPTGRSGPYCVFGASRNNHDWDLWLFRERAGIFSSRPSEPVRLTRGPLVARLPQFSPDHQRLFFIGDAGHAELLQLDRKSGSWTSYLGGIDALQLDFSRDNQWVTFVGPPGSSVWRKKLDGSQLMQLTRPPVNAVNPRWSPDGANIVFYGGEPSKPTGMFLVSAKGGPLTPLLPRKDSPNFEAEPSWSPDGTKILYWFDRGLELIDLRTRHVEKLANSEGLRAPRWSPDGQYAVAADNNSHLILYNMATHERTILSTTGSGYPSWSPDSRYVFFLNGPCSMLYRVDIHSRQTTPMASLDGFRLASHGLGWVGVTPEGAIISAGDVFTRNIYRLDLELP